MEPIKDFIDEIEEISRENTYFRGEPKIYSTIGSGIHRYCAEPSRLNTYGQSNVIGAINLVLNPSPNVVNQQVKHVRQRIKDYIKKNRFKRTTSFTSEYLQHYGGITNFIDFTTNYHVALYFSCSNPEHKDENGRIIFLEPSPNYEFTELFQDHRFIENNRIQNQKSVFVEPPDGYINEIDCRVKEIPKFLKKPLLEYLCTKNIHKDTIYPDKGDTQVNNFIEELKVRMQAHRDAWECDKLYGDNFNHPDTISAMNNIIRSVEKCDGTIENRKDYHILYALRARSLVWLGEKRQDQSYIERALNDCNKALELNPKDDPITDHDPDFKLLFLSRGHRGTTYCLRGLIHLYKKKHKQALADFHKSSELHGGNSGAYHGKGLAYMQLWENSNRLSSELHQKSIKNFEKCMDLDPECENSQSRDAKLKLDYLRSV